MVCEQGLTKVRFWVLLCKLDRAGELQGSSAPLPTRPGIAMEQSLLSSRKVSKEQAAPSAKVSRGVCRSFEGGRWEGRPQGWSFSGLLERPAVVSGTD